MHECVAGWPLAARNRWCGREGSYRRCHGVQRSRRLDLKLHNLQRGSHLPHSSSPRTRRGPVGCSAMRAALRHDSLPAVVVHKAARFRSERFLLGLLTLLGAAFTAPSAAVAACSPATGDNVTVTCSGVTLDQGPGTNTGYGSGSQT